MILNNKLNIQSVPMMASVHWKFDDDKQEEIIRWFERFNQLPIEIRYGLASIDLQELILKLADEFGIKTEEKIGEISRIIREYFIEGKRRDVFIRETAHRVLEKLEISREKISLFMKNILELIQLVEKYGEEILNEECEQIPLLEAIKKYETVADQLVSSQPIKLKTRDYLVRPTVKNWLEDYFEQVGTSEQEKLKILKYLFESKNTEKLNDEERRKLSAIIESFNSGRGVLVDRKEKIIAFDILVSELSEFQTDNKEDEEITNQLGGKGNNKNIIGKGVILGESGIQGRYSFENKTRPKVSREEEKKEENLWNNFTNQAGNNQNITQNEKTKPKEDRNVLDLRGE